MKRFDRVDPSPPRWGAIAGDAVHNTRSALDHLICALALLNESESVMTTPSLSTDRRSLTKTGNSASGTSNLAVFMTLIAKQSGICSDSGGAHGDSVSSTRATIGVVSAASSSVMQNLRLPPTLHERAGVIRVEAVRASLLPVPAQDRPQSGHASIAERPGTPCAVASSSIFSVASSTTLPLRQGRALAWWGGL